MRRFLNARAERAAGRDRAKRPEWAGRGVLEQRTPPLRAARSGESRKGQEGPTGGRERRSLGGPSGRLIAEHRSIPLVLAQKALRAISFLRMRSIE